MKLRFCVKKNLNFDFPELPWGFKSAHAGFSAGAQGAKSGKASSSSTGTPGSSTGSFHGRRRKLLSLKFERKHCKKLPNPEMPKAQPLSASVPILPHPTHECGRCLECCNVSLSTVRGFAVPCRAMPSTVHSNVFCTENKALEHNTHRTQKHKHLTGCQNK